MYNVNQNWNVVTDISKTYEYETNFIEISSAILKLHVDRHDEA